MLQFIDINLHPGKIFLTNVELDVGHCRDAGIKASLTVFKAPGLEVGHISA